MGIVRALSLGFLLATPAAAEDFVDGWALQFKQDVFTKDIVAVAYVRESTESVMKAQIRFQCDATGGLIASFHPGGISFGTSEDVEFKLGADLAKVAFKPAEVGRIGTVLATDRSMSDRLRIAFESPDTTVPFRTEKLQGRFETAGASAAFASLSSSCKPKDP